MNTAAIAVTLLLYTLLKARSICSCGALLNGAFLNCPVTMKRGEEKYSEMKVTRICVHPHL